MLYFSEADKQAFETWQQYDNAENSFCHPEGWSCTQYGVVIKHKTRHRLHCTIFIITGIKISWNYGELRWNQPAWLQRWHLKTLVSDHSSFLATDEFSADSKYVNLLLNPERFTNYKGESANRVWYSIYKENCFKYVIYQWINWNNLEIYKI